ncbi:MAG: cytochrome P450 [Deltaproteobacteria bacterium]|nr:cytochrome P450 [Deltaproteobacteria bacterium]MBI3387456.1 cytochrome P450 [Deltaproteobacteria bacterium]
MQLSDVDLTDPDLFQRGTPHEMFTVLRREAPVFWHPEKNGRGFWAITKYADLKEISKNPGLFSSERQGAIMRDPLPQDLPFVQSIMLSMDPPRHRQYRGLVNKAFSPRMITGLHGRVRDMVKRIINRVIERGECDFVEDIAALLPLEVICEMMGVPDADRRNVYEVGNRMVGFDDPDLQPDGQPSAMNDGQAAAAEMFMYAGHLLEKARTHPGDDLATALVNAELDGHKLSDSDFNFFFLLLVIAGNETTRTVTSNGMLALIDHPDQLRDVRADPSLLPSAIEEILRYAPAVHNFRRTVTADTVVRGQPLKTDDKLTIWYPSVNRDEDVFENSQVFDIRRHPNDHLAFGVGEHFCLGANLARLELNEIFRGIVTHLHDIELAAPPRRLRSTFINGVKEMRIRFRPGAIEA